MIGGFVSGTVTFSTNPQRTRAINAINDYVGNWNSNNPASPLTGSTTSFQYVYPADNDTLAGTSQRALSVSYTSPDYAAVEAAQGTFLRDVTANSYLDVIEMGTGRTF